MIRVAETVGRRKRNRIKVTITLPQDVIDTSKAVVDAQLPDEPGTLSDLIENLLRQYVRRHPVPSSPRPRKPQ